MRIAVFSGSFDPIHCGHAMMANYIAQYCDVDEVWLMPSPLNPLKYGNPPAGFEDRLAMCDLVARNCSNVEVSDFENKLPVPSYTYRTLCALRDAYPQHRFQLVIGSDNWQNFSKWRNPEDIMAQFGLIVYPRPGFEINDMLPENVILLKDAPLAMISSTFLRRAIRENKNLSYFVDPQVIDYISSKELYR